LLCPLGTGWEWRTRSVIPVKTGI